MNLDHFYFILASIQIIIVLILVFISYRKNSNTLNVAIVFYTCLIIVTLQTKNLNNKIRSSCRSQLQQKGFYKKYNDYDYNIDPSISNNERYSTYDDNYEKCINSYFKF